MSVKLVTNAFDAGEISPQLFGRTDLAKYHRALAQCENFFVDPRGGISTRAGSEFVDYVKDDDKATKYVPFRFAPNLANTYMVLFGHQYVRFIQDGAYVLEATVNITDVTQADPGVVTAPSHGYANGDWVRIAGVGGMTRLNGQGTFIVANKTTHTFELTDPFGNDYDTTGLSAYTSGGTVARIYTVTSPYDASELAELRADQIRDVLRLTHPDYAIRSLTRTSHTSWAFSTVDLDDYGTAPAKPSATVNSAVGGTTTGDVEVLYAVTAVASDGEESLPSPILLKTSMANFIEDSDLTVTVSWTAVAGAEFYRVYRSRTVNDAGGMTKGDALGLIAETYATSITDDDYAPDFTFGPPIFGNPFADGAIESIAVTAGGSAYDVDDTVSITTSTGSGFRGELIVVGGVIVAVKIINPGSGYVAGDSVAITTSTGSSATLTKTVSSASGNNPHVSAVFQQRQVYAATDNDPLGLFGSVVGRLANFSTSIVLVDSDAFEYELESKVVVPIRHLVPVNIGLVAFAKDGLWLVSGGNDLAVTPTNVLAEHFPSPGAADVPPLLAQSAILYLEDNSRAARLLSFTNPNQELGGQDISVLANHLVVASNEITSWAYAAAPYSLTWAARDDGTFLSFTLQREHEVFAWAQHSTAGLVTDIASLEEGTADAVYLMVKRYVNGRWTKFIERMASREFANVEEAWCVDAGLQTENTYPAAILTPGAKTGTGITFTASASVFASGDVGKVLRGGGGRATITAFTSGTEVTATITRDFTKLVPQTDRPVPIPADEWSMNATFSTVSGLDHLEGEEVDILLDGKVIEPKTVTDGAVTLGTTGSFATIGLAFRAIAQTVPIAGGEIPIDDSRKRIVGSAVRVHDTSGLKVGGTLDDLYEMSERISANYNTAVSLQSQFRDVLIATEWDENGQTMYVQDFPLPATIVGLVVDMEIGDDTR